MSRPIQITLVVALCGALIVAGSQLGIWNLLLTKQTRVEGPYGNCVIESQVGRFGSTRDKLHGTTRLRLRGSEPYELLIRKTVPVSASQGGIALSLESQRLVSRLATLGLRLSIDSNLESSLKTLGTMLSFTFMFDPALPPEIGERAVTYPGPNSLSLQTQWAGLILSEILGPDLTFSISTIDASITIHPVDR